MPPSDLPRAAGGRPRARGSPDTPEAGSRPTASRGTAGPAGPGAQRRDPDSRQRPPAARGWGGGPRGPAPSRGCGPPGGRHRCWTAPAPERPSARNPRAARREARAGAREQAPWGRARRYLWRQRLPGGGEGGGVRAPGPGSGAWRPLSSSPRPAPRSSPPLHPSPPTFPLPPRRPPHVFPAARACVVSAARGSRPPPGGRRREGEGAGPAGPSCRGLRQPVPSSHQQHAHDAHGPCYVTAEN